MSDHRARIESATGQAVESLTPLSGGCIGEVYRVKLAGGEERVVKIAGSAGTLDIEGYMLRYLADHSELPVPAVHHSEPGLLIMDFIPGESHFGAQEQSHAAELLAKLHDVRSDSFGLEKDTLIGSLPQPNGQMDSWVDFFRERRLLHMARKAQEERRFGSDTFSRIEAFAERLNEWLVEPSHPSLLHGDVWTTNVLAQGGRVTGFIDPAVYYGHAEIELAFSTLFGTFGEPFFNRYNELRPIPDGFFEVRRDIYNLYPLLVHVRLFGGGYLSGIESVLRKHGC
jgi:fructosamine-3-kinase